MAPHLESVAGLSWVRRVARSHVFRGAVTIVLLGYVGTKLDWGSVVARLDHAEVQDVAAAVVLVVVALAIGAYRWRQLLCAAGIHLSISELCRVYAVSTFSGTFLPTSIGGDIARIVMVARRGPLLSLATVTVLIDRAAAFVGLLGLAWIAVVIAPVNTPRGSIAFLAWVTIAFALGGLFVALATLPGARRLHRFVPARLDGIARAAHAQVTLCLRQPRLLVVLLLTSLSFQALVAAQIVLLASAISVHLGFTTAAIAIALVTVATLAPISVGGFGVREGTYVAILGAASINATDATLISLLTVVVLFVASLPGAYLLGRRGLSPAVGEAIPS